LPSLLFSTGSSWSCVLFIELWGCFLVLSCVSSFLFLYMGCFRRRFLVVRFHTFFFTRVLSPRSLDSLLLGLNFESCMDCCFGSDYSIDLVSSLADASYIRKVICFCIEYNVIRTHNRMRNLDAFNLLYLLDNRKSLPFLSSNQHKERNCHSVSPHPKSMKTPPCKVCCNQHPLC
jgi:hypothetical protein